MILSVYYVVADFVFFCYLLLMHCCRCNEKAGSRKKCQCTVQSCARCHLTASCQIILALHSNALHSRGLRLAAHVLAHNNCCCCYVARLPINFEIHFPCLARKGFVIFTHTIYITNCAYFGTQYHPMKLAKMTIANESKRNGFFSVWFLCLWKKVFHSDQLYSKMWVFFHRDVWYVFFSLSLLLSVWFCSESTSYEIIMLNPKINRMCF